MGASGAGFLLLSIVGQEFIPFAAPLVGMSLGPELQLATYLTSRYAPRRFLRTNVRLVHSIFLIGVATSPVIYALLYQATAYRMAFGWAALLLTAATVLFASLPRFPRQV